MIELIIIGIVLMIFGFTVRSQMISENGQKYGMKVSYILGILFFGCMPIFGLGVGVGINVINLTELHHGPAEQTNKFVLWLYGNKTRRFFDKIGSFFDKRIF